MIYPELIYMNQHFIKKYELKTKLNSIEIFNIKNDELMFFLWQVSLFFMTGFYSVYDNQLFCLEHTNSAILED